MPHSIRLLVRAALAAGLALCSLLPIVHAAPAAQAACSLQNPLITGADPSLWYANGLYYLVQSDGNSRITLRAASTLGGLSTATVHTIWTAPSGTDHSAEVWAPELEYVAGRWTIYFAAATNE